MLESEIKKLTAAIKNLTAVMQSRGEPVSAVEPKPDPRTVETTKMENPAKAEAPAELTEADVKKALVKLQARTDRDTALGVLFTFAKKLTDVPPERYQELIDMCGGEKYDS